MRRRVTDTPRANRRTADDDGDNHSDHDGDHDGYNHPSPFIFILRANHSMGAAGE